MPPSPQSTSSPATTDARSRLDQLPIGDGTHTCSSCQWETEGVCMMVEAPLPTGFQACGLWEIRLDSCDACGACCREAFDSVPVLDEDHADEAWVRVHDDGWRDLERVPSPSGVGTWCFALRGDGCSAPFRCIVYERRPATCSGLTRGSPACRTARQRVGLTAWPPGVAPDGHWK